MDFVEKEVEVKDWTEEYLTERPAGDTKYFSDTVPEGQVVYQTKIKFLDEGKEMINNFGQKVISFQIEHESKTKTWELNKKQWAILKTLAHARPLTGKTFELQRTGTTQQDTRRAIKEVKP